jgi:hypothetical protein
MNALFALALVAAAASVGEASEGALPEASVVAASHEVTLSAEATRWRSEVLISPMATGEQRLLRFAQPLPASSVVQTVPEGGEPQRLGDGRIRGVVVRSTDLKQAVWRRGGRVWPIRLRVEQPALGASSDVRLDAPLVAGNAVQRVGIESTDGRRFAPAPELALERHIGFLTAGDVDRQARADCDRALSGRWSPPKTDHIYLRASPLLREHGFAGTLEVAPAQRAGLALAAGGVFTGLLLLALFLYRRLGRSAELERAEAILEKEWGGLGSS